MTEANGAARAKPSVYHENPVIVNEVLGTIFLGLLSLVLLVALLRSEGARRRLLRQMAADSDGNGAAAVGETSG